MSNAAFFIMMSVAVEVIVLVATLITTRPDQRPIALMSIMATAAGMVAFIAYCISPSGEMHDAVLPFVFVNLGVIFTYGGAAYLAYRCNEHRAHP